MSSWKSRHYVVEELGTGLHAAIARPDGYGVCNSGLADLGDVRVVFDTGLTPSSARDLRASAERAFGRPPSLAVNSHQHLDHSLGNSEFSRIPIWGTRRTREIILATHDEITAELKRSQLQKDIHELEARQAKAPTEDARADAGIFLQINRALLASVNDLRIVPPDHTFETRLALPGRRYAELLSFGSGHTAADALMFLPREKVVFAGDLVVVGLQPSMGSGDPEHWLVVLDEIERLGAERIVPGHGPVTTAEGLAETRAYVAGVLEAAEAPRGASLPRALRRWDGALSLQENLAFVRRWLKARRSGK